MKVKLKEQKKGEVKAKLVETASTIYFDLLCTTSSCFRSFPPSLLRLHSLSHPFRSRRSVPIQIQIQIPNFHCNECFIPKPLNSGFSTPDSILDLVSRFTFLFLKLECLSVLSLSLPFLIVIGTVVVVEATDYLGLSA